MLNKFHSGFLFVGSNVVQHFVKEGYFRLVNKKTVQQQMFLFGALFCPSGYLITRFSSFLLWGLSGSGIFAKLINVTYEKVQHLCGFFLSPAAVFL